MTETIPMTTMEIRSLRARNDNHVEGVTFVRYTVFIEQMTEEIRSRCLAIERVIVQGEFQLSRRVKRVSDHKMLQEIERHADLPFDKLPQWLRMEIRRRQPVFGPRQPSEYERLLSDEDWFEHRRYNAELTIDDWLAFYHGAWR